MFRTDEIPPYMRDTLAATGLDLLDQQRFWVALLRNYLERRPGRDKKLVLTWDLYMEAAGVPNVKLTPRLTTSRVTACTDGAARSLTDKELEHVVANLRRWVERPTPTHRWVEVDVPHEVAHEVAAFLARSVVETIVPPPTPDEAADLVARKKQVYAVNIARRGKL